jgi:cell division septum initiation protein DivIVA
MSQQSRVHNEQESAPDLVYSIDQLEDMVSNGKRVPMSRKVMVEEDEFIHLLDEMRTNIPLEIRDATRLLKERERIIGEAQDQATRIVNDAQRRAQVLVSEHTVLAEAKQLAEEELRTAERQRQEARGRMEVFFLQQLNIIRNATLATMSNMEATVEHSLEALAAAESAIGGNPDETL